MASVTLCLGVLLLAGHREASLDPQFGSPSVYITPNCARYNLPGCPRNFNPVCGSDMVTYPNECTLCMKIWEDGQDIKIFQYEPC